MGKLRGLGTVDQDFYARLLTPQTKYALPIFKKYRQWKNIRDSRTSIKNV
jgi:hypothetical protein